MIPLNLVVDMEKDMAVNMKEAVDVEETMNVKETMNVDELVDVEGMMGHIVPHNQVVIHHTEDMPDTVGVGGYLLE